MKTGIDYFPLDVCLDEKFELIEAEFGLTGFSIVVKLFQKIYGGQGYYCEWTQEVALLFARRVGMDHNEVCKIVSAALKRGIFDRHMYDEYGILTSRGIQNRYFIAVSRRKEVKIKGHFLLVDPLPIHKNVSISNENADISFENADTPKQSKVNKSKEKKTAKGDFSISCGFPPPTYETTTSVQANGQRKNDLDDLFKQEKSL